MAVVLGITSFKSCKQEGINSVRQSQAEGRQKLRPLPENLHKNIIDGL